MGLSSGAQTMPAQDYPPWDKVCDFHEKTGSSSPIAADCQACWRGGPPLISCAEMLNAGAHSPPYARTQGEHKESKMHIVTRMAIVIHAHVRVNAICSSCAGMESASSPKEAIRAVLLTGFLSCVRMWKKASKGPKWETFTSLNLYF